MTTTASHSQHNADPAVLFVGAGPGDPELLTLRAARALAQADIVLHDRLVGEGVLALAGPAATLIDIGKGRMAPEAMAEVIASKDRSRAGTSAPACGLYLSRVDYPFLA